MKTQLFFVSWGKKVFEQEFVAYDLTIVQPQQQKLYVRELS
jgi:hypothetical protein